MAFAGNLVPHAISVDDGNKIPEDILTKIELYIKTMCDTNCALRDTWRTKEEDYEKKISSYEQQSAKLLEEIDGEQEKQLACRSVLEEVEKQLAVSKSELSAEQQCRKVVEGENAELRRLRDFARQENTALQNRLALSEVDVKRLEERCKTLAAQLQTAADAKYEALTKCREEKAAGEELRARQDKVEQQLLTLRRHNRDLAGSVGKYKSDLSSARRDYADKLVALEAQLVFKTEECGKLSKAVDVLRSSLKKAEETVQKLGSKLNEQQHSEISMKEGFEKELRSVTEVMNIYKQLSQDGEITVEEALSKAKEMSQELETTISKYVSAEEKQARSESEFRKLLSEKDKCIAAKEQELKATYELVSATIKEEMTEAVEKLPANSELRRQLQDCGSMANFIQHCSSLSEKLHTLKQENKLHIAYMKKLFEEVEAKAPVIKKQRDDYERAMATVVQQSQQVDALNEEVKQSRGREASLREQLCRHEQEGASLRSQAADLGKQVCHLLREVELAQAGDVESSEDVSENLVVFGSIEELQEQNRKLLELFAELNVQKERDNAEDVEDVELLRESLSVYETQLKDVHEEVENYKAMTKSLAEERNTYRKLYQRLIYGRCGIYEEERGVPRKPSDFTVEELTKRLADMDQEIHDLRMSTDSYDKERQASERTLMGERDRLGEELLKASDEAARLYGELQACRQQLKAREDALNAARQRVASLEGQNNFYCGKAADDKRAVKFFKEEALKWKQEMERRREEAEKLTRELEEVRAATRGPGPGLQASSADSLARQHERLAQLLERLQAAGAALERREEQRGAGAQEQLNTAYQECLVLSRQLQEARSEFEDERRRLLTDINCSFKKVATERKLREKLEADLKASREDVERKSCEIVELNKMLADSRATWGASTQHGAPRTPPLLTSTPEADSWRRRVEDLEAQLAQKDGEMELLQLRLDEAQGRAATFSDMSQRFELQWKEEADQRKAAQERSEEQLSMARIAEAALRSEVTELEDKVSRLSGDSTGPSAGLEAAQVELSAALHERDGLRDELRSARETIAALNDSLADMEKHYRQEEVSHLTDSQAVARLKEELGRVSGRLAATTAAKQAAEGALAVQREEWGRQRRELAGQLSQLREQRSDLEARNSLLHDQLEVLGPRSAHQSQLNVSGTTSANSSINSSTMVEEDHTPEQLMKIIKYLRKEKRAIAGKLSLARSENVRIKVQLADVEKQLEESKQNLAAARKKPEFHLTAAVEQEERVKKAEMLFAVKDSNDMLRGERDALTARLRELGEERARAEGQLEPLRAANRELSLRAEKLGVESRAARDEAERLRQQYGQLVESTARANQEERARLQGEREALCEQLAAVTRAHQQAGEQLAAVQEEKSKVEQQVEVLRREHAEEIQDYQGKVSASLKQRLALNQELMGCRSSLQENTDLISYFREQLSVKEVMLEDLLNKQKQMEEEKKMAEEEKKWMEEEKKLMEEDKKKMEEEKMKMEEHVAGVESDNVTVVESASNQEPPNVQSKEDAQEGPSVSVQPPVDQVGAVDVATGSAQSGRSASSGLEEDGELVTTESVPDTGSAFSDHPESQSMETVLAAPQQPLHTTGPSDGSPSTPRTEFAQATSSAEPAVDPTQQVLLPPSASSAAESTQESDMDVESVEDAVVPSRPELAGSSWSCEQLVVAVAWASPPPSLKRPRDTDGDDGSAHDDVKRACAVSSGVCFEGSEGVRSEDPVSSSAQETALEVVKSEEEGGSLPDSALQGLWSVKKDSVGRDPVGEVSSSQDVSSTDDRAELLQVSPRVPGTCAGDDSSLELAPDILDTSDIPLPPSPGEARECGAKAKNTVAVAPSGDAEAPRDEAASPSGDAKVMPSSSLSGGEAATSPSKLVASPPTPAASPHVPVAGSFEGHEAGEGPKLGSGPQVSPRGAGYGRRPGAPVLRYRGTPLRIVWPQSPGGRRPGRVPVLRRMVFRGRSRPPMRGHDRQ